MNYKYDIEIQHQDLVNKVATNYNETNGLGSFTATKNIYNESSKISIPSPSIDNNNPELNSNNNNANSQTIDVNVNRTYDLHAFGTVECNLSSSEKSSSLKNKTELKNEESSKAFDKENDSLKLNTQKVLHEQNTLYTVDDTSSNNKQSFLVHRNVENSNARTVDDFIHTIKDTHLRLESKEIEIETKRYDEEIMSKGTKARDLFSPKFKEKHLQQTLSKAKSVIKEGD